MVTQHISRARAAWRLHAPATALVAVYLSIWGALIGVLSAEG